MMRSPRCRPVRAHEQSSRSTKRSLRPVTKASSPKSFSSELAEQQGFPTISFDRLEIGEAFRSDDRLIRPQDVETYAYAVEDYDPWHFGPSPLGGPLVHPTLLANQALFLRHNHYVVPAGLHARMVFDFRAPITVGMRSRTTGEIIEKYVRRDKPYMVTAYETRSEDGTELLGGRFVQMLFRDATAPSSGSAKQPEPVGQPIDSSIATALGRQGTLEVGQELEPVTRHLEQRQIDAYSGVKPKSIHTDPEWAKAKGFRTTIAQGMMSSAYVSALMTTSVGVGFVVGGRMDVRFRRPVHQGDELTVGGRLIGFSRDGARVRAHAEVQVANQLGETTLSGTASALSS